VSGGRPTSLTPSVQEAICEAIRAGNYRTVAAAAAGVHRNRLAEWEKRGETGEEPYAGFACALQKAEADAEMSLLAEIRNAQPAVVQSHGADVWQSRAWMLERRFASRWCARVKQQVAEHVDALTDRLKADPELHKKVLHVLADQESSADRASGTH
jgi:hypothetical protein